MSDTAPEEVLDLQERSWREGRPLTVEELLSGRPDLADSRGAVLDLLYQEHLLAEAAGRAPDPAAAVRGYVRRFPHLADDIRIQFEVHAAEGPAGPAAADGSKPAPGSGSGSGFDGPHVEPDSDGDPRQPVPGSPAPATGSPPPSHGTLPEFPAPAWAARPAVPTPAPPGASAAWPAGEPLPQIPGYDVLGVLGRGGMGVVLRARQRGLNREVALKVLRGGGVLAGSRELDRLQAEAETLARLGHPHIVGIHEIGNHEGGPFLTLEYCSGGSLASRLDRRPVAPEVAADIVRTLAEAVHAAHVRGVLHRDLKPANVLLADRLPASPVSAPGSGKPADGTGTGAVGGASPGADASPWRADGAGAGSGRDTAAESPTIPPTSDGKQGSDSAVVSGSQGPAASAEMSGATVRVGSAVPAPSTSPSHPLPSGSRPTGNPNPSLATRHSPLAGAVTPDPVAPGFDPARWTLKIADFGLAKRMDAPGLSESGATVGTPSYMAPEQALGRPVGPAADIYGLGAILYELLTGRPPFIADGSIATLMCVISNEPVPPGRLRPGLPADLETICLKCLRKEPQKRYAGADDLAEDLRRWREGEPVLARPAGRWERTVKWVRRRPAAAAAIGLAVAGVLTVVTGSLIYNARLASAAEAERLQRQRADRALQTSLVAAEAVIEEMADRLDGLPGAATVRRDLLQRALRLYEALADQAPESTDVLVRTARATLRMADIRRLLGRTAEAEADYRRAEALLKRLVSADPPRAELPDLLASLHANRGRMFNETGRPAEAESELRTAASLLDGISPPRPDNPDPRSLPDTGDVEADRRRRTALGTVWNNLGTLLRGKGERAEAEAVYGRCLDVRRTLLDEEPGAARRSLDVAAVLNNRGVLHLEIARAGQRSVAAPAGSAAKVGPASGQDTPPGPAAASGGAPGPERIARFRAAGRDFREALDLTERAAKAISVAGPEGAAWGPERSRLTAGVLNNLALLHETAGELPEARTRADQARTELASAVTAHPAYPEFRRLLASTDHNRMLLAARTGDAAGAVGAGRASVEAWRRLRTESPADTALQADAAETLHGFGEVAEALAPKPPAGVPVTWQDAETSFREAAELRAGLTAASPADHVLPSRAAASYNRLAVLLVGRDRWKDAGDPATRGADLQAEALRRARAAGLPEADDVVVTMRGRLRLQWGLLGDVLLVNGEPAKAAEVAGRLLVELPADPEAALAAASVYAQCIPLKVPADAADRAVASLREAVRRGLRGLGARLATMPEFAPLRGRADFPIEQGVGSRQ